MNLILAILLLFVWTGLCDAGTVNRPAKSFGGTQYVNGQIPQDTDFNGDFNTIYGEFNGNISNANISASAAIAASKINPDGFTTSVRAVHAQPCSILDESDQSADQRRWAICSYSGELRISSTDDANLPIKDYISIDRATDNITIGNSTGDNTINGPTTFNHTVTFTGGTSLTPTGMISAYASTVAPTGWLKLDGTSYSCTGSASAYANLCALLVSHAATVNYKGSSAGSFTVDTASNEIVDAAHGKSTGDRVHFSTTGTLPSPLSFTTVYCIISTTTDRFKISTTCGGAEVDITSNGSGTHFDHFNFIVPDARGRGLVGEGTGPSLTARVFGATGGAETHVLTEAQMPAHVHGYNTRSSVGTLGGPGGTGWDSVTGTSTTSTGGGQAHPIMDPFLVMSWIIKL